MKTRLIILTICLAFLGLNVQATKNKDAALITGKTLSEFGSYSINKSEVPMLLDGEEVKTYELVYENADHTVRIGVLPEKNCTSFILKSDIFEIKYMCNKGIFGVKKMDKKFMDITKSMNDAVMDKVSYYAQRVITQKPKTEAEFLGLIACYFPGLINSDYKESF